MTLSQNLNKTRKAALNTAVFRILLFLIFFLPSLHHSYAATNEPDSAFTILPDLEVTQSGHSQFRTDDSGAVTVRSKDITRLARSFGEIDLVNQIRQLSRVSTTSDYASGMVIDGADPTQTRYLLDGAPVVFPYRFGGIFSTFNTPHISSLVFSRLSSVSLPPSLGASFELASATRFSPGIEGTANIGMTASSLTIRGGVANRLSLSLSGRISYIDQVYGRWLESSRSAIGFSFHDLNATIALKLSSSDILKANLFLSGDKVGYDDSNYSLFTGLNWKNTTASLIYRHTGRITVEATAYYSGFSNTLSLRIPQFTLSGPSSVKSGGAGFRIGHDDTGSMPLQWCAGLNAMFSKAIPQWAVLEMTGASDESQRSSSAMPQHITDVSLFGKTVFPVIPGTLRINAEASAGIYSSSTTRIGNYTRLMFSPRIGIQFSPARWLLSLTAGWVNQTMHQVGFSELGLASNFWIGSCREAPLQHALVMQLHVCRPLPWLGLEIEGGAYWKLLENQSEYRGEVMEVMNLDYNPFTSLIISDGYNYGASLGIVRKYGAITGDVSVSYGTGKRRLHSDPTDKWDALNSEGVSVKANLAWHQGKHWELSASFLYASGRRYTPVNALYMIAGNIAMEYGRRNSARLPSYQRLDLGATYYFATGRRHPLRHLVNLSLLNAYGHRNVEMQYFVLNSEKGDYSLKRLYSLYRFLPSINYSIEF